MSFRALLWKDARRELRNKETLQAGLVLVGLFFILYLFALAKIEGTIAAIALWTPLLYATAALNARGYQSEADRGTLTLLQTLPVPTAWHGWSRTIIHLAVTLLLAALTLAMATYGFGYQPDSGILLILLLATIGLTIAGNLAGALAAQTRASDILVPILLIPVAAPLIQAGVTATLTGDNAPRLIMLGYDLIILGIAWILWPFTLEAD